MIRARPSHNNYRCLLEKPHATQQLTAVLNHIRLNQECCLSDWPLLRLTYLARLTCCLKRWNTQEFITFTFHQMPAWFDQLHLGTGLETLLTFPPLASYLRESERTHWVPGECSPCLAFKVRLKANIPPPVPGQAPARGKKSPWATSKAKNWINFIQSLGKTFKLKVEGLG